MSLPAPNNVVVTHSYLPMHFPRWTHAAHAPCQRCDTNLQRSHHNCRCEVKLYLAGNGMICPYERRSIMKNNMPMTSIMSENTSRSKLS